MNGAQVTVNIVVGGRFHAGQLFRCLAGNGYDVRLYTSSPKRYFKGIARDRIVYIPKIFQILQKVLRRRIPRVLHALDTMLFDRLVAMIMRPADILYGFNGDSLVSGKMTKRRGGLYFLDRACPHFLSQEASLTRESAETGYPYVRHNESVRRRFVAEYELADAIIVPSEFSARSFPEQGVSGEKVHVAPLDANAPRPQPQPPGRGSIWPRRAPDEFRVGIVGGSFLRKGILYLLRAARALDRPNLVLYLRANKRDILRHAEARALCEQLNVVWVPYLEDINDFYREIDVFVLPSIDEGFGMVVYEALVNGTPVIASHNVGAAEGLTSWINAVTVAPGDAAAIAEALARLQSSPAERNAIGRAGQAFYADRILGKNHYERALLEVFSGQLSRSRAVADR